MADSSGGVLRSLLASDISAAVRLSAEAGWNQSAEDWCMLLELAPEGCLAIEVDGDLAATTTLLCYGKRLAWVGMVLTKTIYRGRGFARRLMTQALALADQMKIESVKLDATDQGRPLYEKMGFRCEQEVERWSRAGSLEGADSPGMQDAVSGHDWLDADRQAFGVNRSELLTRLARRNPPLLIGNSYLLSRPGRMTAYLGPSVCDTPAAARALMERALQRRTADAWSWDLLPANGEAVAIARALDFTPRRHLVRMVRGKDQRGNDAAIYAIAGFELG